MNIYEGTFKMWAKDVEKEFKEQLQKAYNLGYEDGKKYILDQASAIMEIKNEKMEVLKE